MAGDAAPAFVWAPELPAPGTPLELPADESRYVARVCRARSGERLFATDGRGGVAELRIRETGRIVSAEVIELSRQERSRTAGIACGPPEGERGDWLVEKLAELGVAWWQPVDCVRGRWREGAGRGERWRRLARAALRQSRQAWEMEIRPAIGIDVFASKDLPRGSRWLADPGGIAWEGTGDPSIFAIGPASGFAPDERRLLAGAEFRPLALGAGRLRTETAALCAAALWRAG